MSARSAIRTAYFSIVSSALLAIVKGIAGILGNSFALVADGIESTTDIFASALVLVGIKYSSKPADQNHPYGHGRIEPLITFTVVAFLVISASIIAYQSIINIQTPHSSPKPWTLIVLGLIIIWKEFSYQLVIRKSQETGSSSLKADAWHHRSDAITSVVAFIGISVALVLGDGYENADDWAALAASAFILYNCYLIFRPAWGEIMDEQLYDDMVSEIKTRTMEVYGVVDTEKCYIRKSGMRFHVDLHLIVDGTISVEEGHQIAHRAKDHLLETVPNLEHILIHVEPS